MQKKVVEVLTHEEIAKILSTCDVKEQHGARMHAIVTLMLDTGLRFSEVIALEEAQIDIDNGCLKVLGKGNKERIVPFGSGDGEGSDGHRPARTAPHLGLPLGEALLHALRQAGAG